MESPPGKEVARPGEPGTGSFGKRQDNGTSAWPEQEGKEAVRDE